MFSWVLLSDRQVISIDILPILLVWSLIGSILKTLSNINFTELYFPFELDLNEIRFRVTRPKHIIGTPEQISSSKWLSESLKFPGYMFTVNYCQFHLSHLSYFLSSVSVYYERSEKIHSWSWSATSINTLLLTDFAFCTTSYLKNKI